MGFDNEPRAEIFVITEVTPGWSPTLGSLRAFVSVAMHRNWQTVAGDLKIDATTAAAQVSALEGWLHKMLTLSGSPIEIHAEEADEFIPTAIAVLEAITRHCPTPPAANSKIWKLSLSDIEAFSEMAHFFKNNPSIASYKNVSPSSDDDNGSIPRRLIKKIECSLDNNRNIRLINGHSTLNITPAGEDFLAAVDFARKKLKASRADVSGYEPDPHCDERKDLEFWKRLQARSEATISVLESRLQRKITKLNLASAYYARDIASYRSQILSAQLGVCLKQPAVGIDVSALTKERTESSAKLELTDEGNEADNSEE